MRGAWVVRLVVILGVLSVMPATAFGAGWSVVPSPNPQVPQGSLSGVSCTSASACTAVGDYTNTTGTRVTLAERWNGTSWTIQSTPNPTGAKGSSLSGVSCTSASACTAVGYDVDSAALR